MRLLTLCLSRASKSSTLYSCSSDILISWILFISEEFDGQILASENFAGPTAVNSRILAQITTTFSVLWYFRVSQLIEKMIQLCRYVRSAQIVFSIIYLPSLFNEFRLLIKSSKAIHCLAQQAQRDVSLRVLINFILSEKSSVCEILLKWKSKFIWRTELIFSPIATTASDFSFSRDERSV